MDAYATHLQPLVRAALAAEGDLLELGCGDYSTPLLAEIARHKGVDLFVVSSASEWAARYAGMARVSIVPTWERVSLPRAGMVLLDNEELTRDRIRHLPRLAALAPVVVVHDFEACAGHAHWEEMIRPFGRVEVFKRYQPGTAILWR